jgi:hypothetical protein
MSSLGYDTCHFKIGSSAEGVHVIARPKPEAISAFRLRGTRLARNEAQLQQNLDAFGWHLTAAQVAKLDAASDMRPTYPYWRQRGFIERNPLPVTRS